MTIIWIALYLGLIGAGLVTLYLILIGVVAIVVAIASAIQAALRGLSAASGDAPPH